MKKVMLVLLAVIFAAGMAAGAASQHLSVAR